MHTSNTMPLPLRVGINAHLLAGSADYRRAGIHQYIAQLIQHLPRVTTLQYTVFTGQTVFTADHTQIIPSRWPTHHPLVRILWEHFVWPWTPAWHHLDVVHSMAFVRPWWLTRPLLVTIYDLSFIHHPETFPTWKRLYLTFQTRRACQQAAHIITISESTRQDIYRFFNIPLALIDVVYPGVDDSFTPRTSSETSEFRARKGLPAQFLLHVGTLQPRKNLLVLIEAFAQLLETTHHPTLKLFLVGGKGWSFDALFARVAALGLSQRVEFVGYVPDEELPLWYSAATLLIFPSLYEGFGLPLAQAMACGTAVIAADNSSLPEVVGTAGRLFPTHDKNVLAELMQELLQDEPQRQRLAAAGPTQARRFSWATAGAQVAQIYQRLGKVKAHA